VLTGIACSTRMNAPSRVRNRKFASTRAPSKASHCAASSPHNLRACGVVSLNPGISRNSPWTRLSTSSVVRVGSGGMTPPTLSYQGTGQYRATDVPLPRASASVEIRPDFECSAPRFAQSSATVVRTDDMTCRDSNQVGISAAACPRNLHRNAAMTETHGLNLTTHRAASSVWDRRGWDGTREQLAATRWLIGVGGAALAVQGLRQRTVVGSMLAGIGGGPAWGAFTGERHPSPLRP